jgi:hypothetical protein
MVPYLTTTCCTTVTSMTTSSRWDVSRNAAGIDKAAASPRAGYVAGSPHAMMRHQYQQDQTSPYPPRARRAPHLFHTRELGGVTPMERRR